MRAPAPRRGAWAVVAAALVAVLLALPCAACDAPRAAATDTAQKEEAVSDTTARAIELSVNGTSFSAALEDNAATEALLERLGEGPVTLSLSDYGGFEKVGELGFSLPAEDVRITTRPGDIVLYQGDQVVAFYGSNTWAYTPLAHVDDLEGWEGALGDGSVEIALSLEE